jgi:hypothetical protein
MAFTLFDFLNERAYHPVPGGESEFTLTLPVLRVGQ